MSEELERLTAEAVAATAAEATAEAWAEAAAAEAWKAAKVAKAAWEALALAREQAK